MSTTVEAPGPRARKRSYTCESSIRWTEKRSGLVRAQDLPELRVSAPPAFGGEPKVWTPEELFVASVNACTMMTFLAWAERLELPIESYSSDAVGTLEAVDRSYRFTEVIVRPRIVVEDASLVSEALRALEEAHRSCLVGNSIRGLVVLEPAITFLEDD